MARPIKDFPGSLIRDDIHDVCEWIRKHQRVSGAPLAAHPIKDFPVVEELYARRLPTRLVKAVVVE